MSRALKIVGIAAKYIGQLELKNNSGFKDAEFGKKLISVGFYKNAPWCAFFVKLVYVEAYADNKALKLCIQNNNNGSARETFQNHKANETFDEGQTPRVGAIVIWQLGNGTSGHAGIVESIDLANNTMTCIEGNTNASGSREGDRVARKLRTIERPFQPAGLNVVGYIYPFEIK